MKKYIRSLTGIALAILLASADAHAFIRPRFPEFFAGNSVGIKGNIDPDANIGGSVYSDVAFMMLTIGIEVGHNSFGKYSATAHYSYIEPYIGLQLPVDNWSAYARFGTPFILRNAHDFKYYDRTALSAEVGWRSLWVDNCLLLGTGIKWHWIDDIEYNNSDRFDKRIGMVFINIGYYWGWQ